VKGTPVPARWGPDGLTTIGLKTPGFANASASVPAATRQNVLDRNEQISVIDGEAVGI
jgi:hypothetical protein